MSYSELRKGRHSQPNQLYFITATTLDRQPWFARFDLARITILQLRRLHEEAVVESLAWALMPDHLHWLFSLGETLPLSRAVQMFKGRSAYAINRKLGRTGAVWQPAYHDHALRAEEDIREVARYVVANPLRAGLVRRLGDYPHWDAVWIDP